MFRGGQKWRRQVRLATNLSSLASVGSQGMWLVQWQFFFGACLLTGALLVPFAGIGPVVSGMLLAGLIQLVWFRRTVARRREPRR